MKQLLNGWSGTYSLKQSGRQRIHAPRHLVRAALNDTKVLKRCIEGCESFEAIGEQTFHAKIRAKIGPVNALFAANLELAEEAQSDPDVQSFRLGVELERAAAGFGRGQAKVSLAEESKRVTILSYEIDAVVGGKLAQIGARLVESATSSMAASFFGKLEAELGGMSASLSALPKRSGGSNTMWWVAAAAGVIVLISAIAYVL